MARNIDPGPGYRLLELGEIIESGDQFYDHQSTRWCASGAFGTAHSVGIYKRKIKTMNVVTVEEKSKLVKPQDMAIGQIGLRVGSPYDSGRWCIKKVNELVYLDTGGHDPLECVGFMVEILPQGSKLTLTVGDK